MRGHLALSFDGALVLLQAAHHGNPPFREELEAAARLGLRERLSFDVYLGPWPLPSDEIEMSVRKLTQLHRLLRQDEVYDSYCWAAGVE